MSISKTQEREYAKILYVSERITFKEIAERTGTTEKTISKWATADNWDKLRKSLLSTRQSQLVHAYNQLEAINEDIANRPQLPNEKGELKPRKERVGIPTSTEADTMSKLSSNINKLETEVNLGEYVEVSRKLLTFIQGIDLSDAKKFKNYIDEFINEQLKNG
jgi:transposase